MKRMKPIAQSIAAATLFAAVGSVNAATNFTWNFVNTGSGEKITTWNTATTGFINSTLNVNASAWANTGGVNYSTTPTITSSSTFLDQQLTQYGSHLAVSTVKYANQTIACCEGYPQHAIDNVGPDEMVLFTFNQAVTLNQLKLGFPATTDNLDTDVSIVAYTGIGAMPTLTSLSSMTLAGSSFTDFNFKANKSDVNGGISSFNTGSGAVSSKYWLVGAYNSFLGTGTNLTPNNDFVKIAGLGGAIPGTSGGGGVPEPSSLALVGLGLIGGMRRWKAKKV